MVNFATHHVEAVALQKTYTQIVGLQLDKAQAWGRALVLDPVRSLMLPVYSKPYLHLYAPDILCHAELPRIWRWKKRVRKK